MSIALNWEDYDSGIPAFDVAEIKKLEEHLGVNLPADYVAAVRDHAGQTTDRQSIDVGRGSSSFGALFFVSSDAKHVSHYDNVYKALDDIREWKGNDDYKLLIPFASNTANDIFCLDFRDDKQAPKVVMLDLNLDPEHDRALIPVAQSFEDFLAKLR